jgi:EAL domain-containing protein (putative c-di-GMP-specific phosphodiesterase class I)
MPLSQPRLDCVPNPSAGDARSEVARVLAARSLRSQYQPIFSVLSQRVVGFEALARATDPDTNAPIAPLPLFQTAQREGLTLALDRLCREKAVEGFVTRSLLDGDGLLFLNLDVSILEDGVVGSGHLTRLTEQFGLSPKRVVIELIESRVRDMLALHRFLDVHREQGFLIALDDMGAGNSNLDRILEVRPDILKLDRSLVANIDKEYRKQEAFACCMRIAHKLGIVVIAEGVETESEALSCLERGADLMQGYYFARPGYPESGLQLVDGLARIRKLTGTLRERQLERFLLRKARYRQYDAVANRICVLVGQTAEVIWPDGIRAEIEHHPFVECTYILDQTGIQITDTIFGPGRRGNRANLLFAPATVGADQGSRDYYICLGPTQRRYVTDPYISRATGTLCVTMSTLVPLSPERTIVVCVDIDSSCDLMETC